MVINRDLENAIRQDAIKPFFQPIVDANFFVGAFVMNRHGESGFSYTFFTCN